MLVKFTVLLNIYSCFALPTWLNKLTMQGASTAVGYHDYSPREGLIQDSPAKFKLKVYEGHGSLNKYFHTHVTDRGEYEYLSRASTALELRLLLDEYFFETINYKISSRPDGLPTLGLTPLLKDRLFVILKKKDNSWVLEFPGDVELHVKEAFFQSSTGSVKWEKFKTILTNHIHDRGVDIFGADDFYGFVAEGVMVKVEIMFHLVSCITIEKFKGFLSSNHRFLTLSFQIKYYRTTSKRINNPQPYWKPVFVLGLYNHPDSVSPYLNEVARRFIMVAQQISKHQWTTRRTIHRKNSLHPNNPYGNFEFHLSQLPFSCDAEIMYGGIERPVDPTSVKICVHLPLLLEDLTEQEIGAIYGGAYPRHTEVIYSVKSMHGHLPIAHYRICKNSGWSKPEILPRDLWNVLKPRCSVSLNPVIGPLFSTVFPTAQLNQHVIRFSKFFVKEDTPESIETPATSKPVLEGIKQFFSKKRYTEVNQTESTEDTESIDIPQYVFAKDIAITSDVPTAPPSREGRHRLRWPFSCSQRKKSADRERLIE